MEKTLPFHYHSNEVPVYMFHILPSTSSQHIEKLQVFGILLLDLNFPLM